MLGINLAQVCWGCSTRPQTHNHLPNVGRGSIVADKEVLKVALHRFVQDQGEYSEWYSNTVIYSENTVKIQ